jgi:hypothetical protein
MKSHLGKWGWMTNNFCIYKWVECRHARAFPARANISALQMNTKWHARRIYFLTSVQEMSMAGTRVPSYPEIVYAFFIC